MRKPKLVFLDAGTVDWKDQKLLPLKSLGSFKQYYSTTASQVLKRVAGFDHIVTNKVVFNRATLKSLQGVKGIHLAATGFNNIDLDAAKEFNVAVTNARGYSTESVVQLTFTLLLNLASRFKEHDHAVVKGEWSKHNFFALTDFPFFELAGKTIGIIGYGSIGKRVAEVAKSLGMNVLIAKIPGRKYKATDSKKRAALGVILKKSDAISIHAPLSRQTLNLINSKEISKMKKTAFLINMARGGIVNEKALAHALKKGRLAGAAADVLTQEPPPKGHVLYNVPRLILTPHIAWASTEARTRVVEEIASNIFSYEKGGKRNRLV